MEPERVISFRPRTILSTAAILLGLAIALWVIWVSRRVLTWALLSLFLALALNPAVTALERRGVRSRAAATGLVFLLALLLVAALAALVVPTLVSQTGDFVDALPGYANDLRQGDGPLGYVERHYHVVERVEDLLSSGGSGGISANADTAVSVTKGIATALAGVVTIFFLTFFMLLEGPAWIERAYASMRESSQERWRAVGRDVYATISGYVTGNLLISLIAGVTATILLVILDVPFAGALGLFVAILDLVPLAGATVAAIIVTLVALTVSPTTAIMVGGFFIVYQQLENHLLQPLVYGRTVQLSPLAILLSVLIGVEVAGIVGALAAIPIAGTIQVLVRDWQRERSDRRRAASSVAQSTGTRFENAPAAQLRT
jgi:predicted PurR-regulated permease PerM